MESDPMRFAGHRDPPTVLSEVTARRPILASGDCPPDQVESALLESIYLDSPDDRELDVRIERDPESGGLWRVDIPNGLAAPLSGPRMDVQRATPQEIAETIDEDVDDSAPATAGFRPDWMDLMWNPNPSAEFERQRLRRMNGRPARGLIVFPPDDNRDVFKDPSYPWGCVGTVMLTDGHWIRRASGVLVGPRIVATAAHVVPYGALAYGIFRPAYFDGMSLHFGGSGTYSWVSHYKCYQYEDEVCGWDWAILRLSKPLGLQLGYLGYNGYSSDWNYGPYWEVVGYPGNPGGGERPSRQFGVTIRDVDGDSYGGKELESRTADLSPGNSGGPIWGWWGNEGYPRVIGVVSGEEWDWEWFEYVGANVFAGGSGFTNLVAWGRQHWPA